MESEHENESDMEMSPIGQTGIGIDKENTSATGNKETYDPAKGSEDANYSATGSEKENYSAKNTEESNYLATGNKQANTSETSSEQANDSKIAFRHLNSSCSGIDDDSANSSIAISNPLQSDILSGLEEFDDNLFLDFDSLAISSEVVL